MFMSTSEYNDLFLKCQDTGKYHVFTFDIIGSKKMDSNKRKQAQYKIIELAMMMYRTIKKIERKENKKILVFEENFSKLGEYRINDFGVKQEPFLFGDLIGFTVYRDTISKEEVMQIFESSKKVLNIDFDFHTADGYYETNDWKEGSEKYFRGYCIDLLSNLHKDYNKEFRNALQKQKRI